MWTAAYAAGSDAAGGEHDENALTALLHQLGSTWIAQIVTTTVKILAKVLAAGKATIEALREALSNAERSASIALTEVTRAMAEAARRVYAAAGVTRVRWVTEDDPCPDCAANAAAGPWPLGVPFPSGAMVPPDHVHCRCAIVPA
jgi:hypothetical protein